MKNILLDNWSIERVVTGAINKKSIKECEFEVHQLIEAILLWDDIQFVENSYSYFWREAIGDSEIVSFFTPIKGIDKDLLAQIQFQYYYKYASRFPEVVARGAMEYMSIASNLNVDYFPS